MRHRKLERMYKEENSLQQKASLTVECAFVLPFFFLAVVMITGMLDLYRISTLIQTAMCEGAKELGMYAYCGPEDQNSPVGVVQDGVCAVYGARKIRKELGMYAYCGPEDQNSPVGVVQDGVCAVYGARKIRERLESEQLSGIQGGVNGITLLGSGYKGDIVLLKATFFYQVPCGLFRLFPVRIQRNYTTWFWL